MVAKMVQSVNITFSNLYHADLVFPDTILI